MQTAPSPALSFWRSILFVPVTVERFIEKAPSVGADALMLDLEDSIASNAKEQARMQTLPIAKRYAAAGHEVFVRINRPWRLAVRDLEAVIDPAVSVITLPMVDTAAHVQEVARVISELEQERKMPVGSTKLKLLIETAAGFLQMAEIIAASPRVVAAGLGAEDFAASLEVPAEAEVLQMPKQQLVIAAKAAGVRPMGFIGSIADFKDNAQFEKVVAHSRRFGFQGASCIHPNQVKVCNALFGPSAEEVDWAQRVVSAYEAALQQNVGAITVDGKMVDVPVAQRAQRILDTHHIISSRAHKS